MKTILPIIALLIAGCQLPEPAEIILPPPPPELLPGDDRRQVCLTINSEVNVINARGERRVETAGVSFVTNSGAARIESAGRILYDGVRIVPSCTEQAADPAADIEPSPAIPGDPTEAAAIPIPGGGVIPAFAPSVVPTAGGGGGGGGFGATAAIAAGSAGGLGGFGGAAPSIQSSPAPVGRSVASPSIPGN